MANPHRGSWWLPFVAALTLAVPASAQPADPAPDGAKLYRERCATCHDNPGPTNRAPAKAILAGRTPEHIFDVLNEGAMKPMAAGLGKADLEAIALHLTGKAPLHAAAPVVDPDTAAQCRTASKTTAGTWNGWSPTLDNARYQALPGLKATDVSRLKVKWAFQFAGGIGSQPTVVGGRVYLATGSGRINALDARSGCIHWRSEIKGGVRAAVTLGPLAGPGGKSTRQGVFFGDRAGGVHALDAATGKLVWSIKLDAHPFASITGTPVLYQGRLYVPVSSTEEVATFIQGYNCCSFRGSIAALDPASGKQLWRTFTVDQPATPFGKNPSGGDRLGPAGAAIWSAPTIDARRGVLYVVTGDSYTDKEAPLSDAVLALDLRTGKPSWTLQVTANDNFLVGCTGEKGQPAACPDDLGPDHDFGASIVMRRLANGRDILLAGQKSGEVTALDPDRKGAVLWRAKLGYGGVLGGIEWGMAADATRLFVPMADPLAPKGEGKPGMYALRIADGARLWSSPAPEPECAVAPKGSLMNICTSGLSAAATAIPGVVISSTMDGIMRAYDMRDGKVVWRFDVGQASFKPLNASAPRKGDTINAGGATIVDGTLYQVSGYQTGDPKAVNLLLAFSVDGK